MGVDFYNCSVCGDIFSDAGYYGYCINCEGMMCGHCHDKMAEKHGFIGENHEKASWYGEEAVNHCDACDGSKLDLDSFVDFLVDKIGKGKDELEEEFRKLL
jgi:hypothetical protein